VPLLRDNPNIFQTSSVIFFAWYEENRKLQLMSMQASINPDAQVIFLFFMNKVYGLGFCRP
jgi:hypothetical protein